MSFWGVVRSLPQREKFASERLVDGGFEVFLPLVQKKRAPAPLFSGYFFVRIIEQWRAINTTFGVLCLVRVGDCPARCPDHEVDSLKADSDLRPDRDLAANGIGRGFRQLDVAVPVSSQAGHLAG